MCGIVALCGCALIAWLPAGEVPAGTVGRASSEGSELTFVYIHGFGGRRESPQFCENMRDFLRAAGNGSEVVNYEWDSVEVDVLQAGASWIRSQRRADDEAGRFRAEVIERLEGVGRPYVLVGFSVGSRVVLEALEGVDAPLRWLRGVYFLGSAVTRDTTLANRGALPAGMRIINYHSPSWDKVHGYAFRFMSDVPGGGEVGFDDAGVFENRRVSCTHAHKGVGLTIDYSGLAEAIAAIELFEHGVVVAGRTNINLRMPVMEGEVWWNRLCTVGGDGTVVRDAVRVDIEQHTARPSYFRAVAVDRDGQRTRVARGASLHAILVELGLQAGRPLGAREADAG